MCLKSDFLLNQFVSKMLRHTCDIKMYYIVLQCSPVMQVSMLLFELRMLLCKSRCCYSNSVCYYASLDAVIRTPYAVMQVSMLLFEFRMLLCKSRCCYSSSVCYNFASSEWVGIKHGCEIRIRIARIRIRMRG